MSIKNTMFSKFLKIFSITMVIPILIVNIGVNSIYKSMILKEYSKENQELIKIINNSLRIFILFYFVLILIFIIFTFLYFRNIINPLNGLISKMRNLESLDFNNEIELDGDLEILELKKSYNEMIRKINILVEERAMKEKEVREEEIKALQAQINPHFIYNTLNSIRLMARVSNVKPIEKMIDAFMKLLSSIYKNTNATITLEDEIENVYNYIHIMKVRFNDDILVEVDTTENAKKLFICKFLLQPVVENSILYRINGLDRKGKIIIKSYIEGEFLIIKIIDNGYVLDKTSMINLFEENKNHNKDFYIMGIANINKRIKLNYGNKYGLEIKSEKDKYTCVKFYLPIISEGIKE